MRKIETARIWIGTRGGGLDRLADGRFTNYRTKDGLPTNTVQALFMDGDGVLWIGTRRGLSRLKNGKFTTYTVNDGLYSNFAYSIVEGDDGNLWMSCSMGVFRVSKQELTDFADGKIKRVESFSYGLQDGLRSTVGAVGHHGSTYKAADGTIWFATTGGLSVVDPRKLLRNPLPPPVHIEDVSIDRQIFGPNQVAEAAPGRGELAFHYTALSFVAPERVRFKYKLEGYDRDWVDAGDRRAAYYNNIPPGRYTFRVKAANNEGVWNETGDAYTIQLTPHFYQTIWFYAACFCCAAGCSPAAIASASARSRPSNNSSSWSWTSARASSKASGRFSERSSISIPVSFSPRSDPAASRSPIARWRTPTARR